MEYKNKKIYTENPLTANNYREAYLSSVKNFIAEMKEKSYAQRESFMPPAELLKNGAEYREKLVKMLGYPLTEYRKGIPAVKKEYVASDDMCKIYRLSIEVISGFEFYGILFVPHNAAKAPLVIAQHGGDGTPELCSDMHGKNNYSNFTKILLDNGAAVFAPQLLLWNNGEKKETAPDYLIPFNRTDIDTELKKFGSSITALEIFCLRRSLDYLETLNFADPDKIGMVGISYGGFFTLYTMAIDLRIKAGYACAFFNDRNKVCFDDWCFNNSANMFHDAEVAGLCAPRHLFIDVGKNDPVFDYHSALAEVERAYKYFAAYDAKEHFQFNLWEGGHKIDVDGKGFEFFFKALC